MFPSDGRGSLWCLLSPRSSPDSWYFSQRLHFTYTLALIFPCLNPPSSFSCLLQSRFIAQTSSFCEKAHMGFPAALIYSLYRARGLPFLFLWLLHAWTFHKVSHFSCFPIYEGSWKAKTTFFTIHGSGIISWNMNLCAFVFLLSLSTTFPLSDRGAKCD